MNLFSRSNDAPALIGVIHLPPLPGNARPSPGIEALVDRALQDAQTLQQGGADAIIVENLGDTPYPRGPSDAFTVAVLTRIAWEIRRAVSLPLGINLLRNDAMGAHSVAAAVAAQFIRVNVLTGAMLTDQGVIQGAARDLLLERRRRDSSVRIAADLLVKHAAPLAPVDLAQTARDTVLRAGADAVIITGSGTGQPLDAGQLSVVRDALPDTPLWAGSGITPKLARELRTRIDAAIVGSWLHEDGSLDRPLDVARVAEIKQQLRG